MTVNFAKLSYSTAQGDLIDVKIFETVDPPKLDNNTLLALSSLRNIDGIVVVY